MIDKIICEEDPNVVIDGNHAMHSKTITIFNVREDLVENHCNNLCNKRKQNVCAAIHRVLPLSYYRNLSLKNK